MKILKNDSIISLRVQQKGQMMISRLKLLLLVTLGGFWGLWAVPLHAERKIQDDHDFHRLLGFFDHQKEQSRLNTERRSGLDEHRAEIRAFDMARQKGLAEFKRERKEQEKLSSLRGMAYTEWVSDWLEQKRQHEKAREEYLRNRDQSRARVKRWIPFTEEEEFGLFPESSERVPWSQRKWDTRSQHSKGGFIPPQNPVSGSFNPPPFDAPPPLPPPDYVDFSGEIPPPPPPPPPDDYGNQGLDIVPDQPFMPPPPPPDF